MTKSADVRFPALFSPRPAGPPVSACLPACLFACLCVSLPARPVCLSACVMWTRRSTLWMTRCSRWSLQMLWWKGLDRPAYRQRHPNLPEWMDLGRGAPHHCRMDGGGGGGMAVVLEACGGSSAPKTGLSFRNEGFLLFSFSSKNGPDVIGGGMGLTAADTQMTAVCAWPMPMTDRSYSPTGALRGVRVYRGPAVFGFFRFES